MWCSSDHSYRALLRSYSEFAQRLSVLTGRDPRLPDALGEAASPVSRMIPKGDEASQAPGCAALQGQSDPLAVCATDAGIGVSEDRELIQVQVWRAGFRPPFELDPSAARIFARALLAATDLIEQEAPSAR